MQKWLKITIGITGIVIFLIFAVIVVSYFMLKKPIPKYEGTAAVSGIKDDVEIYRDKHGVAYINANDQMDAVFALGYVHAQERLFQMDLMRRSVAGKLSQVMGRETIPFDRMFKTLGLEEAVEEHYPKLHPKSKQILEAYSSGINAFINSEDSGYPVEFDILGYEPEEWEPKHSLLIAKLLSWQLNISWWSDIAYVHLLQKFGKEKVMEILPDYPENAPTIIPEGVDNYADISTDFIKTDRRFRKFIGFEGTHIGSNNWVVNEKMSKSGAPIIANDPHLTHSVPATWFMAVIKSPQLNVTGFTLPGLPAVVIGKNQDISWVVTNVMADDADFYVEKLDSSKQKYFYDEEWRDLDIRRDTIVVKDSANVAMKISSTHRGPIISDIHPYEELYPNAEVKKPNVSMKWTAYDFSDELFAINLINTAQNWDDFKEALSHYNSPGQNFVYADKRGNIGYICAAKLPIRESMSPTMIYDGTKANNDWKGYVPYSEMPK
jgi:penicillin amidase